MVNVACAAKAAVVAFGLAFSANRNGTVSDIVSALSPLYLDTYTSFTLGSVAPQNQTVVRASMDKLFSSMRELGIGTDVRVERSRIETVSNESALVWLTARVLPTNSSIESWSWTNVFGFRLSPGANNGLSGGFEFAIGDQETSELEKRFPSL